ncbi:MAG: hypothetical protein Kow0099_37580 [Candidatus Abyssubacteria bacterium]
MATETGITLISASLMALWSYSVWRFSLWRLGYVEQKGGEIDSPSSDWAIQVFVRVSALLVLTAIAALQLR